MPWQDIADSLWSGRIELNPDGKAGFSRLPIVVEDEAESRYHGRIQLILDGLGRFS